MHFLEFLFHKIVKERAQIRNRNYFCTNPSKKKVVPLLMMVRKRFGSKYF